MKTVLPNYAGKKVSTRIGITADRGSFWRPARNVWLEKPFAKPHPMKSRICFFRGGNKNQRCINACGDWSSIGSKEERLRSFPVL